VKVNSPNARRRIAASIASSRLVQSTVMTGLCSAEMVSMPRISAFTPARSSWCICSASRLCARASASSIGLVHERPDIDHVVPVSLKTLEDLAQRDGFPFPLKSAIGVYQHDDVAPSWPTAFSP